MIEKKVERVHYENEMENTKEQAERLKHYLFSAVRLL